VISTQGEQGLQRLVAQPITRLHHGTPGDSLPTVGWVEAGNDQREMVHHLLDRAVTQRAHADHNPGDVLGREFAPPHYGRACSLQGLLDPAPVEALREQGNARAAFLAGLEQRFPEIHPHTSCCHSHPEFVPDGLRVRAERCAAGMERWLGASFGEADSQAGGHV
jgi:hypothetical protein